MKMMMVISGAVLAVLFYSEAGLASTFVEEQGGAMRGPASQGMSLEQFKRESTSVEVGHLNDARQFLKSVAEGDRLSAANQERLDNAKSLLSNLTRTFTSNLKGETFEAGKTKQLGGGKIIEGQGRKEGNEQAINAAKGVLSNLRDMGRLVDEYREFLAGKRAEPAVSFDEQFSVAADRLKQSITTYHKVGKF